MSFGGMTNHCNASISARVRVMALALSVIVGVNALPSSAAEKNDFEAICGEVMTNSDKANADSTLSQKLQYCQSAKSSQKGANADNALWKVWSAVAAVCTYACVTSKIPAAAIQGQQYVCMGSTIAAGVTDAVVTKNFASALTSIVSAGTGLLIKSASETTNQAATESAKKSSSGKLDVASCVSAATSAVTAVVKFQSMKNAEKAVESNLNAANELNSNAPSTEGSIQRTSADDAVGGDNVNGMTLVSSDGQEHASTDECSNARSTGNARSYVSCAVASDPKLPSFVKSPHFAENFSKNSGTSLEDFFKQDGPVSQQIAAAMGGSFSAPQAAKLALALQEMQQQLDTSEVDGATYAGSGGGSSGGSGGSEEVDLGALLQGALSGLLPQDAAQEKQLAGLKSVAFANRGRGPNSIAEDRSLNIFDRVSFRYLFVGKRMAPGGGK